MKYSLITRVHVSVFYLPFSILHTRKQASSQCRTDIERYLKLLINAVLIKDRL